MTPASSRTGSNTAMPSGNWSHACASAAADRVPRISCSSTTMGPAALLAGASTRPAYSPGAPGPARMRPPTATAHSAATPARCQVQSRRLAARNATAAGASSARAAPRAGAARRADRREQAEHERGARHAELDPRLQRQVVGVLHGDRALLQLLEAAGREEALQPGAGDRALARGAHGRAPDAFASVGEAA